MNGLVRKEGARAHPSDRQHLVGGTRMLVANKQSSSTMIRPLVLHEVPVE